MREKKGKRNKGYRLIDHTADIGIKVHGKTLKELFRNAAIGCFDNIADLDNVQLNKQVRFDVQAPSKEELLLSWLKELLYSFDTKKILFKDFKIEKLKPTHLIATACGDKLNLKMHSVKEEIKAVTYHEFSLKHGKSGWTAQVIFDV
ncbi:MAG: archease [Candidatus Omnitrophica bacterium]|nr:archease [Candidatus Omnitrophota bacterium]